MMSMAAAVTRGAHARRRLRRGKAARGLLASIRRRKTAHARVVSSRPGDSPASKNAPISSTVEIQDEQLPTWDPTRELSSDGSRCSRQASRVSSSGHGEPCDDGGNAAFIYVRKSRSEER